MAWLWLDDICWCAWIGSLGASSKLLPTAYSSSAVSSRAVFGGVCQRYMCVCPNQGVAFASLRLHDKRHMPAPPHVYCLVMPEIHRPIATRPSRAVLSLLVSALVKAHSFEGCKVNLGPGVARDTRLVHMLNLVPVLSSHGYVNQGYLALHQRGFTLTCVCPNGFGQRSSS